MQVSYMEYGDIPQFSYKDKAYINLEEYLADFYAYAPDIDSFAKAITDRNNFKVDRKLIHDVISEAYTTIQSSARQNDNIKSLLDENTFTIITAHQPSLLGGPLYYILKICSCINAAKQLNEAYPDYNFVPVFINGSEDHDFEEVDHLHLYGKTVKWKNDGKGPVGRFSTEGLSAVISEVSTILGESQNAKDIIDILNTAVTNASDYNDFVFRFVNKLFGHTGLIVAGMDNRQYKDRFIPILKKELLERPSQELVITTQNELEKQGFKAQAFPRDINLFYLGTGDRLRITYENSLYKIVDSTLEFTEEEILEELEKNPQNFSPNVVMRPLYQETIFPNLAYIGGGGEIAYWLERKVQFAEFGVFYPMLIRRNSAFIMDKGVWSNLSKLDLSISDLFEDTDSLINKYLSANTGDELDTTTEQEMLTNAYTSLAKKAAIHDSSLEKSILAEMTRQLKQFDNLGGRIKRSVKAKEEANINRIRKTREKVSPNNGLQERHDNFMQIYVQTGPKLIDFLIETLNPFDRRFTIVDITAP